MQGNETTWAKLAAIYSGLVFGIYWIPIRALESSGFEGYWASLVFLTVPVFLLLPLGLYRIRKLVFATPRFHVASIMAGLAFTLYTAAFLQTEVIRASLLFYLLPVWGFLLGWMFLGEKITPVRWLSMALGIFGMLVIFGIGDGMPIPRNTGDWMALAGGVSWAIASLLILTDKKTHAIDYTFGFFLWAGLLTLALFLLSGTVQLNAVPDWEAVKSVTPWFLPVLILVVIPAGYATVYAPSKLNPGVAGLLFLTEISIAAVTAALWAGEPFGGREIAGVLLISGAGVLEPLLDLVRRKRSLSDRRRDSVAAGANTE